MVTKCCMGAILTKVAMLKRGDGNVELAREVSPLRIAILAGSWVFADKIVDGI